jgi:hypothetical protein
VATAHLHRLEKAQKPPVGRPPKVGRACGILTTPDWSNNDDRRKKDVTDKPEEDTKGDREKQKREYERRLASFRKPAAVSN